MQFPRHRLIIAGRGLHRPNRRPATAPGDGTSRQDQIGQFVIRLEAFGPRIEGAAQDAGGWASGHGEATNCAKPASGTAAAG
jgi:hypothetical protein